MSYFVCEGGGRHYPFGRSKMAGTGTAENESEDGEGVVGGDSSSISGSEEQPSSSSELAIADLLPNASHVFHLPISSTVNDCNDECISVYEEDAA